jgi:hypothetical protein
MTWHPVSLGSTVHGTIQTVHGTIQTVHGTIQTVNACQLGFHASCQRRLSMPVPLSALLCALPAGCEWSSAWPLCVRWRHWRHASPRWRPWPRACPSSRHRSRCSRPAAPRCAGEVLTGPGMLGMLRAQPPQHVWRHVSVGFGDASPAYSVSHQGGAAATLPGLQLHAQPLLCMLPTGALCFRLTNFSAGLLLAECCCAPPCHPPAGGPARGAGGANEAGGGAAPRAPGGQGGPGKGQVSKEDRKVRGAAAGTSAAACALSSLVSPRPPA